MAEGSRGEVCPQFMSEGPARKLRPVYEWLRQAVRDVPGAYVNLGRRGRSTRLSGGGIPRALMAQAWERLGVDW